MLEPPAWAASMKIQRNPSRHQTDKVLIFFVNKDFCFRYTDKELKENMTVAIFRDIMCDLELWHLAPVEVEKLFYAKILGVITSKPSFCKVVIERQIVR